jgi:hypothetical protein
LQQEWQFVQRVTKDIGPAFAELEKLLASSFLPSPFGDPNVDGDQRRELSCLPVKWAGLALPNPASSAKTNYDASILMCSHLLAALRGVETFRSADHQAVIADVKLELATHNQARHASELDSLASKLSCDERRTILRGRETGQWLSVLTSTVNGTELSAQEFRDAL